MCAVLCAGLVFSVDRGITGRTDNDGGRVRGTNAVSTVGDGAAHPARIHSLNREDVLHYLNFNNRDGGFDANRATLIKAQMGLEHAQMMLQKGTPEVAADILIRTTSMEMPDTRVTQVIRGQAYMLLGEIYAGMPGNAALKGAASFEAALRNLDPANDAELIQRARSAASEIYRSAGRIQAAQRVERGNVAFSQTTQRGTGAQTQSVISTCDAAPVEALPYSESGMAIDFPGDAEYRAFEVAGAAALTVTISTANPPSFATDTNLTLYGGCDVGSQTAFDELAFNEDFGGFFTSQITSCLSPGTYWVRVGGFLDITTWSGVTLTIDAGAECFIPTADEYEYDDQVAYANQIGCETLVSPDPVDDEAGEGEDEDGDTEPEACVTLQTQCRTLFPSFDIDFAVFNVGPNPAHVILETGCALECGGCTEDANYDTVMGLSNPLGLLVAVGDDISFPDNLFSRIEFCAAPDTDYPLVVLAFDDSTFPYSLTVDATTPCGFESEPNGLCEDATTLLVGQETGAYHTPGGFVAGDLDWWTFTLTEDCFIDINVDSFNCGIADTYMELYGPVADGDPCPGAFIAANDDENGGDSLTGWCPRLGANLTAGTYYVVTTESPFFGSGQQFLYEVNTACAEPPLAETEPNDTPADALANNSANLGDSILGDVNVTVGDTVDCYHVALGAETNVAAEAVVGGDTTMGLKDAGAVDVCCDDDGGAGLLSLVSACLPAGDWYFCVKDYGTPNPNAYTIAFTDNGPCGGGPTCVADEGLGCPFI
jgi:hypothetical protein